MMEILDCDQGGDAWLRYRMGIPTASAFKAIMANGRGGAESKTRKSYMYRLAAEIITGEPLENFSNKSMERGHALEDEAREYFAFIADAEPQRIGFIRNGRKGCSPDSLIDDDAILEIKTQRGDLLIETILKGEFPPEHKAQVQGQLWIAEREICNLLVYWPGMPPFVRAVVRDEAYIKELSTAVDQFNAELDAIVEKIRRPFERVEAQPVTEEVA
jgi:hypothetical protein